MDDLKIALIGPGGIAGEKLAPALRKVPGACLAAVAGRSFETASAFAKAHCPVQPADAYDDWRFMLRDPALDAVIVATPDRFHAEMAVAALEAGKHVFIEKPMATSVAEADAIARAARESGKIVSVGYHHRWHDGHNELKTAIDLGCLGDVVGFRGVWRYPSEDDWRNAPGTGRWWSLAAVGTHLIDLAWHLLGDACGPVVETACLTSAPKYGRHDETAGFLMKFAKGQIAEIFVSVHGPAERNFEVFGTDGSARAVWTLGGSGEGTICVQQRGSTLASMPFDKVDPYVLELTDFTESVRHKLVPQVGVEIGRQNVEWLCRAIP